MTVDSEVFRLISSQNKTPDIPKCSPITKFLKHSLKVERLYEARAHIEMNN